MIRRLMLVTLDACANRRSIRYTSAAFAPHHSAASGTPSAASSVPVSRRVIGGDLSAHYRQAILPSRAQPKRMTVTLTPRTGANAKGILIARANQIPPIPKETIDCTSMETISPHDRRTETA